MDLKNINTRLKSPHNEARTLPHNESNKTIIKHNQTTSQRIHVMCPTSADTDSVNLTCIEEIETGSSASRSSSFISSSRPQSKPTELSGGPRLQRGMSKATINLSLVSVARDILLKDAVEASAEDVDQKEGGGGGTASFVDTTEFTFTLPDLRRYTDDMKAFIYKDLIDSSTLVSLEQEGHLNWWTDLGVCQRLFPMATSGDGNCLLHAASLGMWGFHDRLLILRKVLYDTLTATTGAFYRRWRYQQMRSHVECGLVLSEEEWQNEWKFLVELASPQPRRNTTEQTSSRPERPCAGQAQDVEPVYESLEELHVFILAHVLRRPIIVIAKSFLKDANGDALSPIPFGGIYIPIERSSNLCHKSPLLLTYDLSHFSALASMEESIDDREIDNPSPLPAAVPLVDAQLSLLPLHFAIDPGEQYDFGKKLDLELSVEDQMHLIRDYFDVEEIPIKTPDNRENCVDSMPEIGSFSVLKNHLTKSDSEESCLSSKSGKEDIEKKSIMTRFIIKAIVEPIDNIGTKLKKMTKGSKVGKMERKSSIGTVTQSTRRSSLAVEMLRDDTFVICAKLLRRKTRYQNEMVENYLETIEKKFREQQIQRREQHNEMRRLSVERLEENDEPCRIQTEKTISAEAERTTNLFRTKSESAVEGFCRQNTIVVAGKSKFYTTSNEDQCPSVDTSVESRRSETDSMRKTDKNSKNNSGLRVTTKYKKFSERAEISNEKQVVDKNGFFTLPQKNAKYERTTSNSCDNGIVFDSHHTLRRDPAVTTHITTKGVRVTADPATFRDFYPQPNAQKSTVNGEMLTVNTAESTLQHLATEKKKATRLEVTEHDIGKKKDVGKSIPVSQEPYEKTDQTVQPNIIVVQQTKNATVRNLCQTEGCRFNGTSRTDFFCSKCHRHRSQESIKLCLTRNCKLPGDAALENLCSLCYQKKEYICRVHYATTKTKL